MAIKLSTKVKNCISSEELQRHIYNLALRVEKLDRNPVVKTVRLTDRGELPEYMTTNAAAADLFSSASTDIPPGRLVIIPTNIAVQIPKGFEGQVRSRSGLALKKGLMVLNSPGTIDSDYRGEIMVILYNTGKVVQEIKKGERIAQLAVVRISQARFQETDKLDETTRGAGGFGSTG
jgi:dUTP pyrophosphatase